MAQIEDRMQLDALPYIDTEIDEPGMRDRVSALVQAEMDTMHAEKDSRDYLSHLSPVPSLNFDGTVFLKREMERVRKRVPMKPLEKERYQLNPPLASRVGDVDAWVSALNNARAQLEHQQGRILNLELMQKYGPNAWRVHAKQVEGLQRHLEFQRDKVRAQIEEVNRKRKVEQLSQQPSLLKEKRKWGETVSNNFMIEYACAELERDIKRLKQELAAKGKLPEAFREEGSAAETG